MNTSATRALLFDIGGVLVDVDFARAFAAWSAYSRLPPEELGRRYRIDDFYARHERGEISSAEYFRHVADLLDLSATTDQIEAGWNAIFKGEIATTRALIEEAHQRFPCYAFTNTNASHMARWSRLYPGVVAAFDRVFVSHQIGLRKPEPAAFEYVCKATGIPAASFVFFDDLPENVQAAQRVGLRGVHVRSPADVAAALREL